MNELQEATCKRLIERLRANSYQIYTSTRGDKIFWEDANKKGSVTIYVDGTSQGSLPHEVLGC